jgi:hypothetical protein
MGRVVNVVVDQSGQVRAAIIDFGGFLGDHQFVFGRRLSRWF